MKKYDVVIDWKFVITFIIIYILSIYTIFHITKNIKIFPKESKQELKTTNKFDSNLIKVGDVFKFTISSNPFKKQNYRYR